MTVHPPTPGTFVAYAAKDGITRIAEVHEYRPDGIVRLQVVGEDRTRHAAERWVSDLTPWELLRLQLRKAAH